MAAVISSTAIFAAADIEATIAYYKDVLGFESSWTWGEPPNFGGARLEEASIMFCLQPELVEKVRGHQHWINVDDADAIYASHVAKGAKIFEEIEDRPWGFREYVVEDPNGYHLRFGGPLSNQVPPSDPFPEGVTIERRKPTAEEYEDVAGVAFGYKEAVPAILERTWGGVVARSPTDLTIGTVRIMHDAPGWFSIWDVAVLPEWQAQRIGSKMTEEAVAMIKEASPGAIVYLFTYKHGFYERLGFKEGTVSLRRL